MAAACERKAPGPAECQQAALRVLALTDTPWQNSPRAREAVDQLTVECLTTPFDREFTRCLQERGARTCVVEMKRRLSEGAAEEASTE